MASIWVADLRISQRTAQKIVERHDLTPEQVRAAVVCVTGLRFTWNDHPERGRRAIVETEIGQRRVLVVLYPRLIDAYGDSWNLGSAYPINPPD